MLSHTKKRNPAKVIISAILILTMLNSFNASADLTFPRDNNSFLIDDADVLNGTEEDQLKEISQDLADGWGTEVILVVINSTAEYQNSENDGNQSANESDNRTSSNPPISVSDYTVALYDHWRIDSGNEWKDGVLVLLSTNQSGSWEWWFEAGCFWDDYMYVFDNVGSSADSKLDNADWAGGLTIISEDITLNIDDFWYDNDGYVDPPNCGTTSAGGDDYSLEDASTFELVFGMLCCLLGVGGVVGIGLLVSRSGNGGGGGFRVPFLRRGGYHDPYYDPYGGYGHGHGQTVIHNHHYAGDSSSDSTPSRSSGSSSNRGGGGRSRRASRGSNDSGGRRGGRRGGGRRGR